MEYRDEKSMRCKVAKCLNNIKYASNSYTATLLICSLPIFHPVYENTEGCTFYSKILEKVHLLKKEEKHWTSSMSESAKEF